MKKAGKFRRKAQKESNKKGTKQLLKRKKQAVDQARAQQELENEIENNTVHADDIDYFVNHARYSGFLQNLDPAQIENYTSRKEKQARKCTPNPRVDDETRILSAEMRPRPLSAAPVKDDSNDDHLLVKKGGVWQKNERVMEAASTPASSSPEVTDDEDNSNDSETVDSAEDVDEEDSGALQPTAKTVNKLADIELNMNSMAAIDRQAISPGLKFRKKMNAIAKLSETVLTDPETAVRKSKSKASGDISELHLLMEYCSDRDSKVQKLAAVSMMAVFEDILPGYRIRLPTEKELQQKATKEVKRLREYEANLLGYYQRYLQHLERCAQMLPGYRGNNTGKTVGDRTVAMIGVKCMCELLQKLTHFNFRSNLLNSVILRADYKASDVSGPCCAALATVMRNDKAGDVSAEIVRQVSKLVKVKGQKVNPGLMQILLYLDLEIGTGGQANPTFSRKRKRDAESSDIRKGLKEAQATVDPEKRARLQSDMLHAVVICYFRVLKQPATSPLLPFALEGLAKYAHLINLSVVEDLLELLKNLLQDHCQISVISALRCVQTALATLHAFGRELQLDNKEYILILYELILRVPESHTGGIMEADLVFQCLRYAFFKRKEYSNDRVAAFIKRLMAVAIPLEVSASLGILACTRALLQAYPGTQQMMDSESDRAAIGAYRPDVANPDYCNPFAVALWEVSLLRQHFHPAVSTQAVEAASLKPVVLHKYEAPHALMHQHNFLVSGEFRPPVKLPVMSGSKARKYLRQPLMESSFLEQLKKMEAARQTVVTFQAMMPVD